MLFYTSECIVYCSIWEDYVYVILVRVESDVRVRVYLMPFIELTEESEEFGSLVVFVDCNHKYSVLCLDTIVVHKKLLLAIPYCIKSVLDVFDYSIAELELVFLFHRSIGVNNRMSLKLSCNLHTVSNWVASPCSQSLHIFYRETYECVVRKINRELHWMWIVVYTSGIVRVCFLGVCTQW